MDWQPGARNSYPGLPWTFSKIVAAEAAAFWNARLMMAQNLLGRNGMIPLARCGAEGAINAADKELILPAIVIGRKRTVVSQD